MGHMFPADREIGGIVNMACQEFAPEARMEGLPVTWRRV